MKWTIIVFIMLSLVGSMMWMMPSPRQKFQAKLRLEARKLGYQVQLVRLKAPRAEGETEEETSTVTAYRLMRTNMDRKESDALIPWQAHRVQAIACDGLPQGWSWAWGEGELSEKQLTLLADVIKALPEDVVALESSPVQVSAFWKEEGEIETLEQIKAQLDQILTARF
ncbi:MAG: hypothetical protein OIF57_13020 [Marinobacterium sp.]|nr:hypothetical protein [Marinobacterium sp.]